MTLIPGNFSGSKWNSRMGNACKWSNRPMLGQFQKVISSKMNGHKTMANGSNRERTKALMWQGILYSTNSSNVKE